MPSSMPARRTRTLAVACALALLGAGLLPTLARAAGMPADNAASAPQSAASAPAR